MIDSNSTGKLSHFLGLFGLNKLKRFFAFIGKKICPQKTIIINNVVMSDISEEIIDGMYQKFQRGFEEGIRNSKGI